MNSQLFIERQRGPAANVLFLTVSIVFIAVFLAPSDACAQYLYHRINESAYRTTVALLGCESVSTNDAWRTFGTAAIYRLSHPSDTNVGYLAFVTAKHNFFYIHDAKTNLLDAIYLKLNFPASAKTARYLRIPIKKAVPQAASIKTSAGTFQLPVHQGAVVQNVWFSERNDLAVIPIFPQLLDGADYTRCSEDQIVTPQNYKDNGILPGCVSIAAVLQLRYFDDKDLRVPETIPMFRSGHLARLGHYSLSDTNSFSRDHVVDLHSSHGNSGGLVFTISEKNQFMLLGVVHGFLEDLDAYRKYEASITNRTSVTLVNQQKQTTNSLAITYVTEANPNLTLVTPVDELIGLTRSVSFQQVINGMLRSAGEYGFCDGYPFK